MGLATLSRLISAELVWKSNHLREQNYDVIKPVKIFNPNASGASGHNLRDEPTDRNLHFGNS